jgi:hypothetical protein
VEFSQWKTKKKRKKSMVETKSFSYSYLEQKLRDTDHITALFEVINQKKNVAQNYCLYCQQEQKHSLVCQRAKKRGGIHYCCKTCKVDYSILEHIMRQFNLDFTSAAQFYLGDSKCTA